MSDATLGDRFIRWAQREPAIVALVQIGSQVRERGTAAAADAYSDWDFQVVTSQPTLFDERAWLAAAELGAPLAYVTRGGRLGSARKMTAVFAGGELDAVIIPAAKLGLARRLVRFGLARRIGAVARGLGDLTLVLRDGYRLLKGGPAWEGFFRYVATEIPPSRLDDREVCALAEGFVCDYISTLRKIDRGEMLAAQRWLHHQLAETNFRLLHELRRRRGEASFPDARRLELLGDRHVPQVAVASLPNPAALRAAVEKAAQACRGLVRELVGERWHWPDLSALGLRGE